MPPKKRYPLEPLLRLREDQVDERAHAYSESSQQARNAEAQRAQASAARQHHQHETRTRTEAEIDRCEQGLSDAEDLMRLHAWRVVQAQRAEELARRERGAAENEQRAQRAEVRARDDLASARADARVIEQHRDRYELEERKAEERRLESEVEDGVNARRGRKA